MARCLISFGANIGRPADTIRQAEELLRPRLSASSQPLQMSRFYRTPPVGGPGGQPPFINAVAAAEVDGSAWDAWHAIREVEHLLGRERQERWEARRIDLDILLFDDERIWTPHFKIPHPRMCMRRFILEPAMDVAADWIEPVSGMTIRELATNLRTGPASCVVISSTDLCPQQLIEAAAAQAHAVWLKPHLQSHPLPGQPPRSSSPLMPSSLDECYVAPDQRWLGWMEESSLREVHAASLWPSPKLVVLLVPPVGIQGAAWEDYHRESAQWLGLTQPSPGTSPSPTAVFSHQTESGRAWPLAGPRYLLTTDDRSWAVHELVAACEAMDCPIEPLS